MSMKQMNKAVATVKSVSKKIASATPVVLPLISIGANVMSIMALNDPTNALNEFVKRYSGVDINNKTFAFADATQGAGSLIATGIIGKVISALVG